MTPISYPEPEQQIITDEGWETELYRDSLGNWSIGVGRNLTGCGLSDDEVEYLFQNDMNRVKKQLYGQNFYIGQPIPVQWALTNMCFNLGIGRLLEFKSMIGFLLAKDYESAADAALDSLWAKQVGERAVRVAALIRKGNGA